MSKISLLNVCNPTVNGKHNVPDKMTLAHFSV